MTEETNEEKPVIMQVEFALDELEQCPWFDDDMQHALCLVIADKNPVLKDYVIERRVVPSLEKIKELQPDFYNQVSILAKYDGTSVTLEAVVKGS